jgi:hypothetical protein
VGNGKTDQVLVLYQKENRIGGMIYYIYEPQWVVYIGVHYLRGKKPPVEIRQVGIIYYHNLSYLTISYPV